MMMLIYALDTHQGTVYKECNSFLLLSNASDVLLKIASLHNKRETMVEAYNIPTPIFLGKTDAFTLFINSDN